MRAHPRFAAVSAAALVWNLGVSIAIPFFSVYLVRHLHATPTQIGLVTSSHYLAHVASLRLWGSLHDRFGAAWVMRLTGLAIPLVPLLWSLAPSPWYLMGVEGVSGFLWAGYSLSSFNLVLGLAPEDKRPRFVAIYQSVVFAAAFFGPFIGTGIAGSVGIRPVFWASATGRLAGATLLLAALRGATSGHRAPAR